MPCGRLLPFTPFLVDLPATVIHTAHHSLFKCFNSGNNILVGSGVQKSQAIWEPSAGSYTWVLKNIYLESINGCLFRFAFTLRVRERYNDM